ncbi:MAG: nucleotidyltransferase domain-containing protein [Chloroflexota bacterium]|nr:nucleotidyltransferase domain-containing protein [Chloroflexota bacterium]
MIAAATGAATGAAVIAVGADATMTAADAAAIAREGKANSSWFRMLRNFLNQLPRMMMNRPDSKQSIAKVAKRYHLDLVVLFGSHAKGYARPDSDMDIAVRASKMNWIRARRVPEWKWKLEVIGAVAGAVDVHNEVDVSFLNRAAPLFLFEVARCGKPLYQSKPTDFIIFQSYAARRYDDNEKFFRARAEFLRKSLHEARRPKPHSGKIG